MSEIISLYGFENLTDAGDSDTALTIYGKFVERPKNEQAQRFCQHPLAGGMFMVEDERYPGRVLEVVASVLVPEQPVLTLYKADPIFNSLGDLLNARQKLVMMLHGMHDATPGRLSFREPQRGRMVLPIELSSMTLVRLLKKEINPYFEKGIVAR